MPPRRGVEGWTVRRDVVVVGASAGGIEVLQALAAGLPADLEACLLVVLHLAPSAHSVLAEIVDRAGPLRGIGAEDGMPLDPGTIIVAPPNRHLLVADGHVLLGGGAREDGHRPSVNALFRSAADAFGPRVIGVVLSGGLDDGADGLVRIVEAGGVAVVQDPDTASFADMPAAALRAVPDAMRVAPAQLGDTITALVHGAVLGVVPAAGHE